MTETMRAVTIREPGGPEVLGVVTRARPQPKSGEILIRVEAAGVNRPDCLQRQGAYPPPPGASEIPGLEIAGTVEIVGDQTTELKVGERVCALVAGGGYAEFCTAPAGSVLPVPDGLSAVEAAGVPETYFTVWHNVFQRGRLTSGETLLVHGGTSGIGTTAIQLAKAFGANVLTTAGTEEKCAACLKLGADLAINYREIDFVAAVKDHTNGQGADVILDMVGGDYIQRNYDAAAVEARIVQIAFLGGRKTTADFSKLMVKRLTHTGSTLRARDAAFKAGIAAELRKHVWPLLAARSLAPVIDSRFPLAEAAAAHRRMEEGHHIGKIILEID